MRQSTGLPGERRGARLVRFGAVGLAGVAVNLGVLHLAAGPLGLPELVASALAVEASILSNFALNDAVTFRDRRAADGVLSRLARWHAVTLVGAALQLACFAGALLAVRRLLGASELGPLRYPAQLAGIALGLAWNYTAGMRFAWRVPPPAGAPAAAALPGPPRPWLAPAVFAAVLLLHLVPIWLVAYVPTQDGPLHVENVLALLHRDGSPLLSRWYLANWGAQPNWLTQALLAPLLGVFSPVVAEKLVLSGYTILFPLSFRAAMPRGARGWWAALAAFPFVHAYPFFMGFWNFCWGLALAFLAVGVWERARGRFAGARWAVLAALSVLLYLAHSVAFAGALVAVTSLLAFRAGIALRRARGRPARLRLVLRGYGLRAAGGLLAALPGLALLAAWTLAHKDRTSARIPFLELAAKFATAYSLVSIDRLEIPLALAVVLVLFVAAVHHLLARAGEVRKLRPRDGWLLAAFAFAVLYFAVPDVVAAGAHVSDRLALFSLLCVAAWIGTARAPLPAVGRAAGALALVAMAALALRTAKQRELSGMLEEYARAGEAIGESEVLLSLALDPWGGRDDRGRRLGYRVKPFLHAAGWIIAARGGVDLKNSQANTDHCPVKFPPDRNPFRTIASSLGRMEGVPPCVDLEAVPRPDAIDHVLVFGANRKSLDSPCGAALALDLALRYEPVYLSAPRGLLQVWRPRVRAEAETNDAPRP